MGEAVRYDLEDRTLSFALEVRDFIRSAPKTLENIEYFKQVIRSSSAIGANYIEANVALGRQDFKMRLRICIKEAKETIYWLKLIIAKEEQNHSKMALMDEATQIVKILGKILELSKEPTL